MTEPLKYCTIARCEIPIRVRYCEVDRQNAVHHSRYAVYFEMGRTELLRLNGYDYRALEDAGIWLVVAKMQCRFKAPARYDDELILTTSLARADRARLEHDYELVRPADRRIIAQGSTTLVHVDRNGVLQPMPDIFFPPEK
jgi:acyl-CoA thioester hydrolase